MAPFAPLPPGLRLWGLLVTPACGSSCGPRGSWRAEQWGHHWPLRSHAGHETPRRHACSHAQALLKHLPAHVRTCPLCPAGVLSEDMRRHMARGKLDLKMLAGTASLLQPSCEHHLWRAWQQGRPGQPRSAGQHARAHCALPGLGRVRAGRRRSQQSPQPQPVMSLPPSLCPTPLPPPRREPVRGGRAAAARAVPPARLCLPPARLLLCWTA